MRRETDVLSLRKFNSLTQTPHPRTVVSELTQNFVTNATNINSLMLHNSFIIAATLMLDHGDEDCDVSLSEVFLLTLEDIVMDSCDFFVLNSLCLEPYSEGRQNHIRDKTAVANLTELQRVFLNKTIRESPNRLNMLYELGAAWGTTRGVVNTVYVTAMWWIGGDGEVEEIVANGLSGGERNGEERKETRMGMRLFPLVMKLGAKRFTH